MRTTRVLNARVGGAEVSACRGLIGALLIVPFVLCDAQASSQAALWLQSASVESAFSVEDEMPADGLQFWRVKLQFQSQLDEDSLWTVRVDGGSLWSTTVEPPAEKIAISARGSAVLVLQVSRSTGLPASSDEPGMLRLFLDELNHHRHSTVFDLPLAQLGGKLSVAATFAPVAALHVTAPAGDYLRVPEHEAEAVSSLPPSGNPDLSQADLEFVTGELAELDKEGLGVAQLPATALKTDSRGSGCDSAGALGGLDEALGLLLALAVLFLTRPRRHRALSILLLAAASILWTAGAASAQSRLVYGYLSFWDTRPRSDLAGSKHPTCNPSITNCTPGSANCCFTGVPNVTVELRQDFYPYQVKYVAATASNGLFVLGTDDPITWNPYIIVVRFERDTAPLDMEIKLGPGVAPPGYPDQPVSTGIKVTLLQSTWTYVGNMSLSSAGDQTSILGDLASVWTTVYDITKAFEADGEFRQRKKYQSPNALDRVYVSLRQWGGASVGSAHCTLSQIDVRPSSARGAVPAHEFAHILNGRVTDCDPDIGGLPAFPHSNSQSDGLLTSEGWVVVEAFADAASILAFWNPAVADWPSIRDGFGLGCHGHSGSDNSNDVGCVWNSANAIWDQLDSPATYTDDYADYIDVSVADLMDALLSWRDNVLALGDNYSNGENFYTPTITPCGGIQACAGGDACLDGVCVTGDPHGENVADWFFHLWLTQVPAGGDSNLGHYWNTLASHPCIGRADNTHPFTGGYRSD